MAEPSNPTPQPKAAPSLLRAAGLIAMVTLLSKGLGALRDWQVMTVYGASLASDAYFAAFQLPSFAIVLLGGLGGPFHTATVSIFSKLLANQPGMDPEVAQRKAKQLAGTFITLTGLVFLGLSILTGLFAHPIMAGILGHSAEPAYIQNAAHQLQIMSPVIFFGGLIGIFYGLLNVFHQFFWPSLSPAMLNIVMIVALLVFPHDQTGELLAWSTLVGTLFQFAVQIPDFLKQRFSLKPTLKAWKTPELNQIGELLFPALVGTTIGQTITYVDLFFSGFLATGGWTAVVLSNRLIQLPIGVMQTALLVPIFPRFAKSVAEERFDDLRRDFQLGVVSLWLLCLPMLVCLLFFTEPLIRLVFEHGQFDAKSTHIVSQALLMQAFQMLPYFARDSLTRVFYAFNDAKTPLLVGLVAILLKAFSDWLLVVQFPLGVAGITLSTTLITAWNMVFLALLSKKHIPHLGYRTLSLSFAKLALATLAMAGLVYWLTPVVSPWIEALPFIPQINDLLLIILTMGFGLVGYGLMCYGLKIEAFQLLINRFFKKPHAAT